LDVGQLANATGRRQPIHIWHTDVHQNHVGLQLLRALDALRAVLGLGIFPVRGQHHEQAAHQHSVVWLIFDV
jgi:hypothetical protein